MAWKELKDRADKLVRRNPEEALDTYKKALKQADSVHEKVYSLGGISQVLINMDRAEQAEEYINQILELNPNNKWAKSKLSVIDTPVAKTASNSVRADILDTLDNELQTEKKTGLTADKIPDAAPTAASVSVASAARAAEYEPMTDGDVENFDRAVSSTLAHSVASDGTDAQQKQLENMAQPEPLIKKDDSAKDIALTLVGEFTGISGSLRVKDVVFAWLSGSDESEFKKEVAEMNMFDIFDVIYWIGVITAGIAGLSGAGVGSVVTAGITAVAGTIFRVLSKKMAVGAAIKLLFKQLGKFLIKNWRKMIYRAIRNKRTTKAFFIRLKDLGMSKESARICAQILAKQGKLVSKRTLDDGAEIGTKGVNFTSKTGKITVSADDIAKLRKSINKIPINKRMEIAVSLGMPMEAVAKSLSYAIKKPLSELKKQPGVLRKVLAVLGLPASYTDDVIERWFFKNKGRGLIKVTDTLNAVGLGLELGDIFNDYITEKLTEMEMPGALTAVFEVIQSVFNAVDAIKLNFAISLWEYRQNIKTAIGF